ncbi:Cullin repeat-like-containing domain protein [Mycena sanguinolenta]|nr:Cullin repeat-like-containing domain protein [Mycena sanguinolenta]
MMSSQPVAPLPPMPNSSASFDEYWAFFKPSIEFIIGWAGPDLSPYLSFTDQQIIYTAVYNCCTSKSRDVNAPKLYATLSEFFASHSESIYRKLEVKSRENKEDLLYHYAYEWDQYMMGAIQVNRLFSYMNRAGFKHSFRAGFKHNFHAEGDKTVYDIVKLVLIEWRDHVFVQLQPSLTSTIFALVNSERDGGQIDRVLVKKVVDSFVALGLDAEEQYVESLDLYKAQFEHPFLKSTEAYYAAEAESLINAHHNRSSADIANYLDKVEGRLREETKRTKDYLHVTTRKLLIGLCEKVMLHAHNANTEPNVVQFK